MYFKANLEVMTHLGCRSMRSDRSQFKIIQLAPWLDKGTSSLAPTFFLLQLEKRTLVKTFTNNFKVSFLEYYYY